MISFSKIMKDVLTETMSFRDLFRSSDPARVDRAKHVKSRSLRVDTIDNDEAWLFSYKSQGSHSTTGNRWQGYIRFLKKDVSEKESAEDLQCMVDCSCPDYRYRWAYNNNRAGASPIGNSSLNKNNGRHPQPQNDLGEGMCKHLLSLGDYLKTHIDPVAPNPDDEPTTPMFKGYTRIKDPSQAPDPDDDNTYSDSRSGGSLQEGISKLYNKFKRFVKQTPVFEIQYEDDENTNANLNSKYNLNESARIRGEWWIENGGDTTFADGDIGDYNHEAIVIERLNSIILSHFGIDNENTSINEEEDNIVKDILEQGDFTDEEKEEWLHSPSEVIYKKLVEDKVFGNGDPKQTEEALYIAYGSSSRDARDYAMQYWKWKVMKGFDGGVEIQTWHLTHDDLKTIIRGIDDALGEFGYDDEMEDKDITVNITVQSSGKRFSGMSFNELRTAIPSDILTHGNAQPWMKESLTEEFHVHKEYRLYEGEHKITVIFEDNTRLSFDVHFRNNHGDDKHKWRKKAFSKWKTIANKLHRDIQLTEKGNPVEKSWKQCFQEALKDPVMKEFIRTDEHKNIFDNKISAVIADPVNFTNYK